MELKMMNSRMKSGIEFEWERTNELRWNPVIWVLLVTGMGTMARTEKIILTVMKVGYSFSLWNKNFTFNGAMMERGIVTKIESWLKIRMRH